MRHFLEKSLPSAATRAVLRRMSASESRTLFGKFLSIQSGEELGSREYFYTAVPPPKPVKGGISSADGKVGQAVGIRRMFVDVVKPPI